MLVLAVALFYGLQKFVVTTSDGVSLEIPLLSQDAPAEQSDAPDLDLPTAELVIDEPDYSAITTDAGEDLAVLHGLFVPCDDISADGLTTAAETAAALGAQALVLEMKPANGSLSWSSTSETALAYGTSGRFDITESLAALKEQGFYLAAQISVCADDLIAARNPQAVLKTPSGTTIFDDAGGRLDPYNSFVRSYVLQLLTELDAMGFDEIILANLSMPETEEGYVHSQQMTYEATPLAAVSSFAHWVNVSTGGLTARVSAVYGDGAGQDAEIFFKMFDRLCCAVSADNLESTRTQMLSAMSSGDAAARFAPICAWAQESGSWIIKTE